MGLRCAVLLVAVLAVLTAATPAEERARQQLLRRLPNVSWSRLAELERLVEATKDLSTEELLRRTGTLELYRALPEASAEPDRLNLLIGLLLGPYITPLGADSKELSLRCRQQSWQYVTNILSINNTWALKMFDSIGKLPDGIFAGNTNPVGVWDECLSVEAVINGKHTERNMFKGKYCRPQFIFPTDASEEVERDSFGLQSRRQELGLDLIPILPPVIHVSGQTVSGIFKFSVGLCMPSSCSAEELKLGLQTKMNVGIALSDGDCHVKDQETTFSAGDIAVMTIMCVVGFLMALGTFIDAVQQCAMDEDATISIVVDRQFKGRLPLTLQKVLLAFSVLTNGRKLLDTSSSSDTLGCLHGIRFLSMTWVLLGHQYVFGLSVPWTNNFSILGIFNSLPFAAVDNATVSVDSFFFLSGLLVTYIFMRNMERSNGKFNIIMYYVHRYIRLTPLLAMVIAFICTLYVHLGDGPFWNQMAEEGTPAVCRDYWWRNLLYVNNLFDVPSLCVPQTWYLSVDMQLFIASPIVLLPLFFYPILGQIWLILLIALNMFITGYVTWYNNLGPFDSTPDADTLRYFMPYCRYGAYLVGVYTGWFLHQRRRRPVKLSLPVVLAGWLSSALVACLIIYGPYEHIAIPPLALASRSESVIYGAMNRPVWAMCLAWVVIACVHGYGGFINTLLSWRFWIPFSRITYCCYLVSIDTQKFFYASLKSPLYFDQTNAVYQFLATLSVIVAVATVFSLAFESPMLALEKIIFANVGTASPKRKKEPKLVAAAEPEQDETPAEEAVKRED